MPIIKKNKTTKKKTKKTVSRVLVKAKPTKNTLAYYECMCHQTKQGLKGKKITGACHECKHNALAINAKMSAAKTKAVNKIKKGYAEVGAGLQEFIKACQ